MQQIDGVKKWSKVGENLVRYQGGKIYLRAKVAGKIKQVSLQTTDLRIAKLKRDALLSSMRKAAKDTAGDQIRTVGDAINTMEIRTTQRPDIRPATVAYYREIFGILRATMDVHALVRSWTASEASAWWKSVAKTYAAQRANNVLGMAKQVSKMLVDHGNRIDDPTAELKRVPIKAKALVVPSRDELEALIADIRGQGKAFSEEAANFVGFLAFAGCRVGQARVARWEHVQGDWLEFPSGVSGTKGAKTRRLPISPPLRAILDRMTPQDGEKHSGPIFHMKRPHEALGNACARLKIPHLRIHDLRHFFATYALESGVDAGTVSRWLGHKDGGVLVLRTYGHLRDDHSLASAKKLI